MVPASSTPSELLRAELRRDGARPLITFYDDATGERVELSVTTFDNWVAKTAGLLQDGLSAEIGSRIGLAVPAHWQSLVWGAAGWAIGACVVTGLVEEFSDVDVAVVGPDTLDSARGTGAHDVVALSLRPLGGRFTIPLPDGVLDYAVEGPGYPDQFTPYDIPAADEPALEQAGVAHTLAGVIERARQRADQLGAGPGARLLVSTDDVASALIDALLVPLVVGGSAVLVRNEDPAGREARVSSERVTVVNASASL